MPDDHKLILNFDYILMSYYMYGNNWKNLEVLSEKPSAEDLAFNMEGTSAEDVTRGIGSEGISTKSAKVSKHTVKGKKVLKVNREDRNEASRQVHYSHDDHLKASEQTEKNHTEKHTLGLCGEGSAQISGAPIVPASAGAKGGVTYTVEDMKATKVLKHKEVEQHDGTSGELSSSSVAKYQKEVLVETHTCVVDGIYVSIAAMKKCTKKICFTVKVRGSDDPSSKRPKPLDHYLGNNIDSMAKKRGNVKLSGRCIWTRTKDINRHN